MERQSLKTNRPSHAVGSGYQALVILIPRPVPHHKPYALDFITG